MRLKGKTALITGAAQGLGQGMALRFAREGAVIFAADVQDTGETLALIAKEGATGYAVKLDVTSEESWAGAAQTVEEKAGKLDILVNNAGINIREVITEMPAEHFDKMMAVNVKGPFLGCKYFIPVFKKNGGGSIINMSSQCGLVGHRYTPEAYTVTKGAITLLTKCIATRYGADNIRSNCLCPATVNTPMLAEKLKDPEFRSQRFGEVPLGRLCTTDDVANAALFLASDEASYINGVAFPVDGGSVAD
jgi:NAD(P)-dependent dehydrogenase (short-subunit alcohol dehydrogenase family)